MSIKRNIHNVKNYIKNSVIVITCLFLLFSCDVQYDAVLWDAVINPASDTSPPSNVTELLATAGDGSISLSWTNPTDADFDGVEISATPAEGNLSSPVKVSAAENKYSVTGLKNDTLYNFTVKSRDKSSNISAGVSVSATPVTAPDTAASNKLTEAEVVFVRLKILLVLCPPNS